MATDSLSKASESYATSRSSYTTAKTSVETLQKKLNSVFSSGAGDTTQVADLQNQLQSAEKQRDLADFADTGANRQMFSTALHSRNGLMA